MYKSRRLLVFGLLLCSIVIVFLVEVLLASPRAAGTPVGACLPLGAADFLLSPRTPPPSAGLPARSGRRGPWSAVRHPSLALGYVQPAFGPVIYLGHIERGGSRDLPCNSAPVGGRGR